MQRPTARRPSRKDPRGRGRCDPCSRIRRIGSRGWSSMRVSFVRCASCVCFALCVLRFAFCALLLLPVLAVISYINKTLIGTGKVPVLQGVVTVFTQCREKVDVVCKSCARPNKNRNFRPRNTPDFQTKSRCRRQSKFRRKFSTGSRRCPTRRAFNARRVKHRMRSRHKAFALILGHSAPESRTPGGSS